MISLNHLACEVARNGDVEQLNDVIKQGANYWDCIAEEAAECGHHAIVQQMINRGARDINSIACYAAKGGHPSIVFGMIDCGANNYDDILCSAVQGCSKEVVYKLALKGHSRWRELAKTETNNIKFIRGLIASGVNHRIGIVYDDLMLLFLDGMLYVSHCTDAKKEITDLGLDITVGVNHFIKLDTK